jgi:HK97 family phage major capsid protein
MYTSFADAATKLTNIDILEYRSTDYSALTGEAKTNLVTPQYNDLFAKLGVKFFLKQYPCFFLTVPVYNGSTFYFMNENGDIPEGSGSFSEKKLDPYRIGVKLDISEEWINQTNNDGLDALVRDMIQGIWRHFIKSFFGNQAGTAISPEGLFYNTTRTVSSYSDFLALENDFLDRDIIPSHYITNPAGFQKLQSMVKVYNAVENSVLGVPLVVDYAVGTTPTQIPQYALGNFSDLYVAQYGDMKLTINPYTKASYATVQYILNAYLNAGFINNSVITALLT